MLIGTLELDTPNNCLAIQKFAYVENDLFLTLIVTFTMGINSMGTKVFMADSPVIHLTQGQAVFILSTTRSMGSVANWTKLRLAVRLETKINHPAGEEWSNFIPVYCLNLSRFGDERI